MHITLTIEVINPNVLKVDVDLESNVEDANSCTANVYGSTVHLSFTFDVVHVGLWLKESLLLISVLLFYTLSNLQGKPEIKSVRTYRCEKIGRF